MEEWPCPIQDFPALLDTETGLMWGKEITEPHLIFYTESVPFHWANRENFGDDPDNPVPNKESLAGGYPPYDEDHPDGWRLATMTEMLQAHAAGLFDPSDVPGEESLFDFSYQEDHQGVDDPVDETDPTVTWGDRWHSTGCVYMQGKRWYRWAVRCGDGSATLLSWSLVPIPVRGAPPNHDDCPHKHKGVTPDNPGLNK